MHAKQALNIFGFFRIMIAALSFLIDYEKIEGDDDSDDSDSEDDQSTQQPLVVVNKEAIYKVGFLLHPFFTVWSFTCSDNVHLAWDYESYISY